ncbi:class I SAM-dependent methyltransferase [Micromonospora echinofusca]|uniref:Methyltransferase domain-containing protein n=1 Tax=Micromonospora echinofusca TaxID=47858 RepID=A0ABS3VPF9_MICEH|nr:methyltransferase domain-containing protein [Micromonospora echinofusca]MBO4206283.1 methyltransferase domain-containing protein [Micromonospora echinofusca]
MARIAYDDEDAAAFAATRHLPMHGLTAWRAAVARHLRPQPGIRVLDLGCGTGMWARAFTDWYAADVVGVEPAAAMRRRCGHPGVLAGDAGHIPLPDADVAAAWLSTMIHHVPDLHAAARELRRVVRPGGPVLIRSVFAGRPDGLTLFAYFPEAVRVLDTYPSVAEVTAAFRSAGFATASLEQVPQLTAESLAVAADELRRDAHTLLKLIGDDEYAAGLARLREAVPTRTGPVVDTLDLLVLR